MAVVDDGSPAPHYVDEELDKEVEKRAAASAATKKHVHIYIKTLWYIYSSGA